MTAQIFTQLLRTLPLAQAVKQIGKKSPKIAKAIQAAGAYGYGATEIAKFLDDLGTSRPQKAKESIMAQREAAGQATPFEQAELTTQRGRRQGLESIGNVAREVALTPVAEAGTEKFFGNRAPEYGEQLQEAMVKEPGAEAAEVMEQGPGGIEKAVEMITSQFPQLPAQLQKLSLSSPKEQIMQDIRNSAFYGGIVRKAEEVSGRPFEEIYDVLMQSSGQGSPQVAMNPTLDNLLNMASRYGI